MSTVAKITEAAGGRDKIADALSLTYQAVAMWETRGIPQKHWRWIMTQCDVTAQQLHEANELARRAYPHSGGQTVE